MFGCAEKYTAQSTQCAVVKKWNQVGDGLAMRKPLFESLEEHEWEEVLRKLNKFYTNKENKSEMDKVGLH